MGYLPVVMTRVPPRVSDLVDAMDRIAPTRLAAPWDNVGLLVGDASLPLERVLLTVDLTRPVLEEALHARCSAVVAYHPPLFDATKRFLAGSMAFEAARSGIAVYSPHTALDVADGGTNDVLADILGLTDRAPLRLLDPAESAYKLVTFVPAEHVEALSRAVFEAGAGYIGQYSSCSFRTPGTGTFFGEEGANPVVGKAGRLEEAAEVRVETLVPIAKVEGVVRALRRAHPYEEPAFDLVRLVGAPEGRGFGRVGKLPRERVRTLVDRVKRALGAEQVLFAGSLDAFSALDALDAEVTRAAVCAGSGGELVADALRAGAEVFLTGELRHHDALKAVAAGMNLVCVRHSTSERVALGALEKRLAGQLPKVSFSVSREDRDPFEFV